MEGNYQMSAGAGRIFTSHTDWGAHLRVVAGARVSTLCLSVIHAEGCSGETSDRSPAFRLGLASLSTNLPLSRTLSETLSTVPSPTKFPTKFPSKMGREHGHANHRQRFNAGLFSGCPLGDEGVELPKGIILSPAQPGWEMGGNNTARPEGARCVPHCLTQMKKGLYFMPAG